MPAPICTFQQLVQSSTSACIRDKLSPRQRQLFRIYFNAVELSAIGGTNYLTGMNVGSSTPQIITDAVALARTLNLAERDTMDTAIDLQNAQNAGGSPLTDTSSILAAVSCIQNYPDYESIRLLLKCQLGYHETYPQ